MRTSDIMIQNQTNKQPIGILGGTFDPIHNGHIQLALHAYKHFHCAEIKLIPCKQPVLKSQANASTDDRLAMLKITTDMLAPLTIDTRELNRETPSYMVETLASLKQDFLEQTLILIMAYDAFKDLAKWHQWEKLLDYCHITVANRPGYELKLTEPLASYYERHKSNNLLDIYKQENGLIHCFEFPAINISSTKIRELIAAGESEKISVDLLPQDVLDYIQKHNLYI